MPIISSFFGILVRMYFDDHPPPHIHVEYQGHEALLAIADGRVLNGSLPRRAEALVQQWCVDHRRELEEVAQSSGAAAAEPHSGSRQ
jgi:hypothetical protein